MDESGKGAQESSRSGRRGPEGKRRWARQIALQMLYQCEVGESTPDEVFRHFDKQAFIEGSRITSAQQSRAREALEYAQRLVTGTTGHEAELDELIRKQADHWRLERMSLVDRNILRLAVYELLYEDEVPKLVVLDEAIELAKRFGADQSGKFVNGILDGLIKTHAFPGPLK